MCRIGPESRFPTTYRGCCNEHGEKWVCRVAAMWNTTLEIPNTDSAQHQFFPSTFLSACTHTLHAANMHFHAYPVCSRFAVPMSVTARVWVHDVNLYHPLFSWADILPYREQAEETRVHSLAVTSCLKSSSHSVAWVTFMWLCYTLCITLATSLIYCQYIRNIYFIANSE